MLSVQQMQTLTVFSDNQSCGYVNQVSYYPITKQEVISSSEDDDSYDELDMYESLPGDKGRVTYHVSQLQSKPETNWSLLIKTDKNKDETGLPELQTQEELRDNKVKLVKKKKFRKVRCSKLTDRGNKTNEVKNVHLEAEKPTENDQRIINHEPESYQTDASGNASKTTETHKVKGEYKRTSPRPQNTGKKSKQIKKKTREAELADISLSLQTNKRIHDHNETVQQSNASSIDSSFETVNHEVTNTEFNDNGLTNQDITIDFKQLLDEVKFSEIDQNGRKVYQCRVCSKIVDNRNKLKHHNSIHNREPAYLEKLNFTKMTDDNGVDIYQCVVCSQTKSNRRQMIRHQKSCLGENKGRLKLKQFLERFRITKTRPDERDMYQCNVCSKVFKDRYKARDHYTIHTGERSYKCQECGDSFRLESTLRAHKINKHSTERNYICSICNKTYKHASYLRTHMNIHTKTRFKCDLCGSDYSAIHTLKDHIMYKHLGLSISNEGQSKVLTPCIVCQKTFANSENLKLHMQTHDGTQKFNCDICGALFSRRVDRDRHRMRHTGQRPFKCDECDYGCITKGELNRHKLKHVDQSGGQAKHKCPYCDKTLVRKNEMTGHIAKEHLSVESVKTSFFCKLCDTYHVSRYALNRHMAEVHKNSLNHDCVYCDRTFSSVGNRNRHIERTHMQKTVTCNVCEKTFQSKVNLQDHCRLVHKDIRNK